MTPKKRKNSSDGNFTLEITDIWQKYERGNDYIHKLNLVNKTDKCHRFYMGDQWYGLKSGGEELPSFNFIKGIVKYKVSTVAQNSMTAVYSSLEDKEPAMTKACELLGRYFQRAWERGKLDSVSWKMIKDAAIQGDAYLYFGGGADTTESQMIDNVNIFFADEQSSDIQSQRYIIIRERRFVEDIRREALENGISEDDIDLIISDEEREDQLGDRLEVEYSDHDGKCISLLYMEKDEKGIVHVSRSVKNLIYQPDTALECTKNGEKTGIGLRSYPIVNFIWDDKKGSGRGVGEVEYLIPNQIEVNKTIARRAIAVKNTAYPMLAYADNLVVNPDELDVVGGKIAINNGNAQAVNQLVSYLTPAQISPDAKNLSDELTTQTRELSGAGDNATGSIDPTQASGTAIIAVRDQAALPLNEQLARYSQFVEDLAYLWFDMWVCYNPNGIEVEVPIDQNAVQIQQMQAASANPLGQTEQPVTAGTQKEIVPAEVLQRLKVNVKVDVSKANPFSLYAREQSLHNYWQAQAITFEEMVEALPEGSAAPKDKLKEILKNRQIEEQKQAAVEQLMAENQQYAAQMQQMTAALQQASGEIAGRRTAKNDETTALKEQLGQSTEALNGLMAERQQNAGDTEALAAENAELKKQLAESTAALENIMAGNGEGR